MNRRLSLLLLTALAVSVALGLGVQRETQAADGDVRLVVILASGWNSSGDFQGWQHDWAEVRAAMSELNDNGKPQAVVVDPFTYAPGRPGPYRACADTNQSIRTSAAALVTQASKLLAQYRNARLMVVGHSLGGVIATYWLAETLPTLPVGSATAQRLRDTTVVTLDSPVKGLDLAMLDRLLGVRLPFSPTIELGHGLIRWFNCHSKIPDELDSSKPNSVVSEMAKAAQLDNYHTGASAEDLFIHFPEALLSKKDSKLFNSGADCMPVVNAEILLALTRGALDGGLLQNLYTCVADTHGAVLRDPAARAWVKGIAAAVLKNEQTPLATPAQPATPTSPQTIMTSNDPTRGVCASLPGYQLEGDRVLFSNSLVCVSAPKAGPRPADDNYVFLKNPSSIEERNKWIDDAGRWLAASGRDACTHAVYLTFVDSGPLYSRVKGVPGEKAFYALGGIRVPHFCNN